MNLLSSWKRPSKKNFCPSLSGIKLEIADGTVLTDALDADTTVPANTTVTAGTSNKDYGINVSSQKVASGAITTINKAIESVSAERSKLGAYQNRLEHTIRNVDNTAENLTAAKSRIEDADMALEMSEFVKLNILQQAGTAMLAQANKLPQTMLQLLQ